MLPNVPGYREYDFISISKSEYNELKEQNSKQVLELLLQNHNLRDALRSLLDGLDSNYDERCGLTNKQWEERIRNARKVLKEN